MRMGLLRKILVFILPLLNVWRVQAWTHPDPAASLARRSSPRRLLPPRRENVWHHRLPQGNRVGDTSLSALSGSEIAGIHDFFVPVDLLAALPSGSIDQDTAEAIAGPFFGLSLFPYLLFLYFLNVEENAKECSKGIVVGFATCLLFVFLTIPAAIDAKLTYGMSLADVDYLHGSAESLLTITNLVTVLAFREVFRSKDPQNADDGTSYGILVLQLTLIAAVTAFVPAFSPTTEVHTPYLNGFMDISDIAFVQLTGANPEPANALSVACWIIHISSLVEFLVAMGFCWRWADIVGNPRWKGLTWGLLPLHSSGITACTYHVFYNAVPILVPLQAFLTCVGNSTAAYAALRIALSNGWKPPFEQLSWLSTLLEDDGTFSTTDSRGESSSLVGFEDIGEALEADGDYTFLFKLFGGCAIASYVVKYGETFFDVPYEANLAPALAFIFVPSLLNAYKWYKRSLDPSFEGWF